MECHLPNYNFCGPFTNLNLRLNPDQTPKEWSMPVNKLDEICMRHDIAYAQGDKCEADETMLRELRELENGDMTCNELIVKYFMYCVVSFVYHTRKLYRRICSCTQ